MLPAVATPLWRANCPHCTRQLHFKAAPGASPIVVCGACGQRFEAETTPGGAPPQPRSNGHRAPEQSALSEAEELDIAIAISLSDGAPSPTPRAKLVQGADDFWKCPLCVCCNSRTVNRCVCGHERQRARGCAPAPHHAPSAREMPRPARVCPACTFESPSGSAVCSMCGQAFGNGSAPATQGVRAQPPSQPLSQPPLGREAVAEEGSFALLSVDERQATQEKESRALLRQIEAFCTKQRCSFVDDSFFPSDRSVYLDGRNWSRGDVQERPAERSADARVTQWLRPAEIARRGTNPFDLFEQPWCVFRGDPLPEDIKQGSLGDCWLLSAIAVLAERPVLLRALFPAGGALSASGAYPVRLCLDGEWRVIVVDDMLPCTRYGTLAFSQAARRQLCVPLLEKAFAKAYGCYEFIEAGTCDEALAALTGAPCEQLRLQPREGTSEAVDEAMLWARLLSFREAGFLAGASCGSRDASTRQAAELLGLQTMHAYSVTDVRLTSTGDRLVRLRNPWGRGDWTGAWSARSPQWTAELRRELRLDGNEGGTFWMGWRDFLAHFRDVDVCKVRVGASGWMEARARAVMPTSVGADAQWHAYSLSVFETTEVDLLLTQRNSRGRGEGAQLDCCVCVFRAAPGVGLGELVASSPRRVHASVCCEALLGAGEYLVLPLSLSQLHRASNSPGAHAVVLSVFSAKPVLVAASRATPSLVRNAIVARVVRHGVRTQLFDGQMVLFNQSDEAGSVLYAENHSWMQRLTVTIDARVSFNLVSSRAALQMTDSLSPGQGQLLLALTQLEPSEGFSSAFKFQFRRADMGGEHHTPPVLVGGLHSAERAKALH